MILFHHVLVLSAAAKNAGLENLQKLVHLNNFFAMLLPSLCVSS